MYAIASAREHALIKERNELTEYLDTRSAGNLQSVNMAVFDRLRVINRELRKLNGKEDTTHTDR